MTDPRDDEPPAGFGALPDAWKDSFVAEDARNARRLDALRLARDTLRTFQCECTHRCERIQWLPADNSTCAHARVRSVLTVMDAAIGGEKP